MRLGVVYKVWFEDTKYFLYGSTINFKNRKSNYLSKLKRNIYSNTVLQNVYNKHTDKFIMNVVQDNIPEDMLEIVEDIWMGASGSIHSDNIGGMNLKNAFRPKFSQEAKVKLREALREFHYKPILQIDILSNKIVFEYPCTIDVRENGFDNNSVRGVLIGKNKTAGGFFWRFKGDGEIVTIDNTIDAKFRDVSALKGRCGKSAVAAKPILQIDKTTKEIIAEYVSIQEAVTINGWKKSAISCALNGHSKSSYGFLWEFKISI